MPREETWSVPLPRAISFFRSQPDVSEEAPNHFRCGSCRIRLTELKPKDMGIWASKRIRIQLEGDDPDVESIYHRFFIQFLSTGG